MFEYREVISIGCLVDTRAPEGTVENIGDELDAEEDDA